MTTKPDLCQQATSCSVIEEMDNDYWYNCFHRYIQAWNIPFEQGHDGDPPCSYAWDAYYRIADEGDPGQRRLPQPGGQDVQRDRVARHRVEADGDGHSADLEAIVVEYDEFLDQPEIGHEPGDDEFLDLVTKILVSRIEDPASTECKGE